MDNRYDMQYFSSAAILELLKKIARLKMYARDVSELAKDSDSIFTQDLTEELIKHVGLIENLALRGNEMIYEENDGLLFLVNALPEGRDNQHLLFWDETEVQEKIAGSHARGYTDGIKSAADLAKTQDAKIMEQANRIEALEDELAQLRK